MIYATFEPVFMRVRKGSRRNMASQAIPLPFRWLPAGGEAEAGTAAWVCGADISQISGWRI